MKGFIVFDKRSGEVVVAKYGTNYVLPISLEVIDFDGVEPLLVECNGRMVVDPRRAIIPPGALDEE